MAYSNHGGKSSGGNRFGGKKFGGAGSGRSFGGRKGGGFGDSRREPPTMHKTTCSDCNESCEVPFKPNGKKPVLCNDCFKGSSSAAPRFDRDESRGSSRSDSRDGQREFVKKGFGERNSDRRSMYEATCADCGVECEVPFKPNGSKPVYCRDCFVVHDDGDSSRSNERNERREPRRDEKRAPQSFGNSGEKDECCSGATGGVSQEQFDLLNTKIDRLLKIVVTLASGNKDSEEHKPAAKKEKAETHVKIEPTSKKEPVAEKAESEETAPAKAKVKKPKKAKKA